MYEGQLRCPCCQGSGQHYGGNSCKYCSGRGYYQDGEWAAFCPYAVTPVTSSHDTPRRRRYVRAVAECSQALDAFIRQWNEAFPWADELTTAENHALQRYREAVVLWQSVITTALNTRPCADIGPVDESWARYCPVIDRLREEQDDAGNALAEQWADQVKAELWDALVDAGEQVNATVENLHMRWNQLAVQLREEQGLTPQSTTTAG